MMSVWGPFVFASLLKIRVIVIAKTTRTAKVDNATIVEWSTWIFSKRDNVKPVSRAGVHRMPDDEFRKEQTIEIFYMCEEGEGMDKHYQFLRRGYCDGPKPPTTEPENVTLLSILKEQFRHKRTAEEVPGTDTAENLTNELEREEVPGGDSEGGTERDKHDEDVRQDVPGNDNLEVEDETQGRMLTKRASIGKVPRKRSSTTHEPKSSKKHRTRKWNAFEEYSDAYFDFKFWTGTSEHRTPARMKYDSVLDTFWVCHALRTKITEAEPCDDITKYDPHLVEQARRIPDIWHGCSIGDSIDCDVPSDLKTKVPVLYQQLNRKFCLSYSIASALYYCGFEDAARIFDSQARLISLLLFDQQLEKMKDLMPGLVPLIGRPTIYTQRRCRNKKKKTSKKARCLTWDSLFDEIVPHPTLIVPLMPDGKPSHAFCVVDDLIFESSFPYALKLQQESIEWIYGDPNIEIFQVFRFNMKCSPKGHKVEGSYKRPVRLNWDRPCRVFVERDSSNWNLPHYIVEK